MIPNQNCQKCSNQQMQRVEGIYALTKVEKDKESGGITFMPASGIPVVAFICPTCGEIKLFPAKLFNEI